MPKKSVVVTALEPVPNGSEISQSLAGDQQKEEQVIPAFTAHRIILINKTRRKNLKERAIQTANYITYYLQPDDRIVVGFQYNQWWYSCHIGVIFYLFDFIE